MASKLNPLVLHLCRTLHTSGRWVTRLHGPECAITAKFCLLPIPRPRSFSSISQLDGVDGIKAVPDRARRSRVDKSSLIINGKLRKFKSRADFGTILEKEGRAYFDRTRYISVLDAYEEEPILFFRPRRFGKSLTVDMLAHFHGLQYADVHKSIYQGLDVQNDIAEGRVMPGQFFILKFDFSTINRSPNIMEANQGLKKSLNFSFEEFYDTYATYLGRNVTDLYGNIDSEAPNLSLEKCTLLVQDAISQAQKQGNKQLASVQGIYLLVDEYDSFSNDYLEPYSTTTWDGTAVEQTFKSFWSMVKSLLDPTKGISRTFIIGISPLSLTDIGSGFNVGRNLSFDDDVAGLCGLTYTDIEAALKEVCGLDLEAYNKHLSVITEFFNGHRFCNQKKVETIYNTETCLSYLQSLIEGKIPQVQDPPNSEVSERFLKIFASSPSPIKDLEEALKRDNEGRFVPLAYTELKYDFKLADLRRDIKTSRPSWRSLMLYFGGLTFYQEDPAHYLQISNAIAAKRIAQTVLEKYGLRESLNSALEFLEIDGDIRLVLSCYYDLMVQRDVGYSDFEASEQVHRDSFYFSLLRNASLRPHAEFMTTKLSNVPGRCDLVLPLRKHLIVTEWKAIQIDYLDIPIKSSDKRSKREIKALILSTYTLEQVLDLKFSKNDKFRAGKTLKQWIIDKVAPQVKGYVTSEEVRKELNNGGLLLKAHLVVVIGSRHILMWDIDSNGELAEIPELVGRVRR